eukprot:2738515-Ditylum_brightwellii.AAC.1
MSNLVIRAAEGQNDMGWHNFIKGQIVKDQCLAQANYCRDMPNRPTHNPNTLSTKLIKALWSIFVDVLNARNSHLHTEMENTNNNIHNIQVWKVFALEHSMSTSNRLLFHMDLIERIHSSPKSKQLWLESVKIAVHDFKRVHKHTPSQCVITDFFSNISTTTQGTPQEHEQWNDVDTAFVPSLI